MKIAALIPAAGKSRRMGRPKLSLQLGGKSVLEHTIAAVRGAGAAPVLVVVGPDDVELSTIASANGAEVFRLAQDTAHMRATVEHGLTWFEAHGSLEPDDAWLLLPADHPTLDAAVVRPLVQAAHENFTHAVFVPTYQGKRGHPTLIRWRLASAIRALPADAGLNTLFRSLGSAVREVPTATPDVLLDMDTPEDFAVLQQRHTHPAS